MLKRVSASILAFLLALTVLSPFRATGAPEEIDYARIYYDFFREISKNDPGFYFDSSGRRTNDSYKNYKPVTSDADMADFDGDGVPELLIAYNCASTDPNSLGYSSAVAVLEVFGYKNGSVIRLDSITGIANKGYFSFSIASYNNKYYIHKGYFSWVSGTGMYGGSDLYELGMDGLLTTAHKAYIADFEEGYIDDVTLPPDDGTSEDNRYVEFVNSIETKADSLIIGCNSFDIFTENLSLGNRLKKYFKPIIKIAPYDPSLDYDKIYNKFIHSDILPVYGKPLSLPYEEEIGRGESYRFDIASLNIHGDLITAKIADLNDDKVPELIVLRYDSDTDVKKKIEPIMDIFTCDGADVFKVASESLLQSVVNEGAPPHEGFEIFLKDTAEGKDVVINFDFNWLERGNLIFSFSDKGFDREVYVAHTGMADKHVEDSRQGFYSSYNLDVDEFSSEEEINYDFYQLYGLSRHESDEYASDVTLLAKQSIVENGEGGIFILTADNSLLTAPLAEDEALVTPTPEHSPTESDTATSYESQAAETPQASEKPITREKNPSVPVIPIAVGGGAILIVIVVAAALLTRKPQEAANNTGNIQNSNAQVFCSNCGNKLNGGEKFCSGCGESLMEK